MTLEFFDVFVRRELEDRVQQERRKIRGLQDSLERRDKEALLLKQRSDKVGSKQKEINELTVVVREQKERLEKQEATIQQMEGAIKKREEVLSAEVKIREEEIARLKSVQATLKIQIEEGKRDLSMALDVSTSVVSGRHALLTAMIRQLGRLTSTTGAEKKYEGPAGEYDNI